jgi:mannan endo-1,4-beta-mannosidase
MIRHAVCLFITAIVLWFLLVLDALAGQFCVIDPPRPGASTGFYVAQPSTMRSLAAADTAYRIMDPSGNEWRPRGVNRAHDDQGTAGMGNMGANAVRIAVRFTLPPATAWGEVQSIAAANGLVPIVGNWTATCKADPASLAAIVDIWVAQAPTWTQLNASGIVNIANEWGPPNSVVWRDSYVTAVQRMRAAGYTGMLMVDSGGCGQDAQDVVKYGADVLAADPLHNVLFDVHVYGAFHYPATATWMQDAATAFAQLKASGLPIVLGEYGPVGVGPSATQIPLDDLITIAEGNGWGHLAWAADDGPCPGSYTAASNGFSMVRTCWDKEGRGDGNLSTWGLAVVTKLRALNGQ